MANETKTAHLGEILSLNDADLQIDELEQRLEMAIATPSATCGTFSCGQLQSCGQLTSCNTFACPNLGGRLSPIIPSW